MISRIHVIQTRIKQPILDLQSIPRESNNKDVAAMLVELTIEANEESFVIVHQHGGNDVNCNPRIVLSKGPFFLVFYFCTFKPWHLCLNLGGIRVLFFFKGTHQNNTQVQWLHFFFLWQKKNSIPLGLFIKLLFIKLNCCLLKHLG